MKLRALFPSLLAIGFILSLVLGLRWRQQSTPALKENPAPSAVVGAETPSSEAAVELSAMPEPASALAAEESVETRASDRLIDAAQIISEHWDAADAAGNRTRTAVLHAADFKYPSLRTQETWSAKTETVTSRVAMVADHVMLVPKPGADPAALETFLAEAGFSIRWSESGSFLLAAFTDNIEQADQLPAKIAALAAREDLVEFAEPDYLVFPAMAQAPATNDMFGNPVVFTGNYGTWAGSNIAATREPSEELWYGLPGERSLWFLWQPSFTGTVELNCSSLGEEVRIAVYEGNSRNQLRFWTDSAANDPREPHLTKFLAQQGLIYRIVALSNSPTGEAFSLSLTAVGRNDAITSPLTVQGENFSITDSNRSAGADSWEIAAPHAGTGAGKSMWYRWQPPSSGTFTLNTQGSGFDTVLAVYQGNITLPGSMQKIAANDDADPGSTWSACSFEAQQGKAYMIAVDSAVGNPGGTIRLNGLRPTPVGITGQPQSITTAAGASAAFTVKVAGSAPFAYQWFRNGAPILGAVSETLEFDKVAASDFASYQVRVGNAFTTVFSTHVQLMEMAAAPCIVWTNGDQTVAPGSATTLRIQASGSGPLGYQWSRDDIDIPGATGPGLDFLSPQEADSGFYRCTVTNALGSADASVQLQVNASPWQGWQWRRDNVPGATITDIKEIDGQCVAVAGDRLLISSDAIDWEPISLPLGFNAASIAKLGPLWICTGSDPDGNPLVSTSGDGRLWSVPVATTGVVAVGTESRVLRQVLTLAGRFVAWNGKRLDGSGANSGGRLYWSINGIAWTPATGVYLSGAGGGKASVGCPSFLTSDGLQILFSSTSASSSLNRVMRTTDGMTWTEGSVIGTTYNGDSVVTYYAAGNWHYHVDTQHYVSVDGLAWQTAATTFSSNRGIMMRAASVGNEVLLYYVGTRNFAWGDPATEISFTDATPAAGATLSVVAEFQGSVVYGTFSGDVGKASSPDDFHPPGSAIGTPSGLAFLNDEFIASGGTGDLLFSGDGMHWSRGVQLDVGRKTIMGFAGSRYYATAAFNGFLPDGLTDTRYGSAAHSVADNGSVGMMVKWSELLRSTDHGETWTPVVSAPVVDLKSQVWWVGGRWFLTKAAATTNQLATPYLYHSADGLNWAPVRTMNPARIAKLGTKWYALGDSRNARTTVAWESENGITWSAMSASGLPEKFNVRKLISFNDVMVAFITGPASAAYHSFDGKNWLRGGIPADTIDMETGVGKLVALASNGAIIATGPVHSGGSAPIINVDYPAPVTYHLLGSTMEITGRFSDPDGGSATLSCIANGTTIATQSVPGEFRFRFEVANPDGYAIRLRAVDAAGLVTATSLRVLATSSQLPNLFAPGGEGETYLDVVRMVELEGVLYASGTNSLWRSLDEATTWQQVPVPSSFTGTITNMAAGNGALVLELGPGTFATTHNGVDWEAISIPSLDGGNVGYLFPLAYQSGWFVAGIRQGSLGILLVSRDGITWRRSLPSKLISDTSWVAVDEAGTVFISSTFSTTKGLFRSTNFGDDWSLVSPFGTVSAPRVIYQNGAYFATSGNKSWISPDGVQWTSGSDLPALSTIVFCGDRFFAKPQYSSTFSHVSADGINWQPTKGTMTNGGFLAGSSRIGFLGKAYTGTATLWSADGVTWQAITNGPSGLRSVLLGADGFLAADGTGGLWRSADGTTWTTVMPGKPVGGVKYGDTSWQPWLVSFGERLLTGGGSGGVLHLSAPGFSTWTQATLGGNPMPASCLVAGLTSNDSRALAVVRTAGNAAATGIFRTTNGIAWTKASQPASTQTFRGIAENGSQLIAVGNGGVAMRSIDDGITWSTITIPEMVEGRAVAWFADKWIVIGIDSTVTNAPLKVFYSTNGASWIKGENIGMASNSLYSPTLVAGHGRLVCSSTYGPVTTTNGTDWSAMALIQESGGTIVMDMAVTPTGWVAVLSSSVGVRTRMWAAPPDGSAWTPIPPYQERVNGIENVGSRIFLLGEDFLSEWVDRDFAIRLDARPAVTLGVGDTLIVPVTVCNLGSLGAAENLSVDAWLSTDGVFGNTNDIYLGRVPLVTALPGPGGEVSVNLGFELPYTIRPGNMRLIVRLDAQGLLAESNISNNVDISSAAQVIIPGRRLTVAVLGGGTVTLDVADGFYLDGATAVIHAESQPGWTFVRWSGDLTGASADATLTMTTDKSVTARFTMALSDWRQRSFTSAELADAAISGSDADPDHDGVPNWREWLQGSNPKDATSTGRSAVRQEGTRWIFNYSRMEAMPAGHAVRGVASANLRDWTLPLSERVIARESGIETLEATFESTGHPRAFFSTAAERP